MSHRYYEVYLDIHHMEVAGYQLPDLTIQNAIVFAAEQGSPVRNPFYSHREILNCYKEEGTPIAYLGGGFLLWIDGAMVQFPDYPNPADGWPTGWRRCIMTAPGCERFLRALHRGRLARRGSPRAGVRAGDYPEGSEGLRPIMRRL